MERCVTCHPPVGLTSVCTETQVTFHVAVKHAEAAQFSVAIWHNGTASREWQALDLSLVRQDEAEAHFTGDLIPKARFVHFTVKYRHLESEWSWLNDLGPVNDGKLIFQTSKLPSPMLDWCAMFKGMGKIWQMYQLFERDDWPWMMNTIVMPSKDGQTSWTSRTIGTPALATNWFALVRHSSPWLAPRTGSGQLRLDKDALFVSFLREDGLYVVLLPVNGVPHTSLSIHAEEDGALVLKIRNDGRKQPFAVDLVVAVGLSLDGAIEAATANAKMVLSKRLEFERPAKRAHTIEIERWYDAFGYCTWNGLGQKLSEKKLLDALDRLEEDGVQFTTLVIDDNWQSLDFKGQSSFDFRWSDFEANFEGFPNGLKNTIRKIRQSNPKIRHIAAWHGLFGYWGGIDPAGKIAKTYKHKAMQKQTGESYLPNGEVIVVQGEDVGRMYDDFYAFLASCGIDAVKADNQFMPDYLADAADRVDVIYAYQEAWSAATAKHFQHRGMACMAQTPQILFNTFLKFDDRPPYLVRNSDDFFPNEPSSHAWHIYTNAHNSLLTKHFNLVPDWDMFQTAGQYAKIHALARCLSGGPIYITDKPGHHDLDLIASMTTPGVDGSVISLRPEVPAVTMEPYVNSDSPRMMRLATSHHGISLLGIMNLSGQERYELLAFSQFPSIDSQQNYIILKHSNTAFIGPVQIHDAVSTFSVTLKSQDADIFTATPVHQLNDMRFAVLGIMGKFTGAAAIRWVKTGSDDEPSTLFTAEVKALGLLGVWLQNAESHLAQGRLSAKVTVGSDEERLSIKCDQSNLLCIDFHDAVTRLNPQKSLEARPVITLSLTGRE